MKLLWNNYLDDSTVTATNENTNYPASNLNHRFLEKKFQAIGDSSTVTILMPETRTVSMIAYGFNNIESSQNTIVITKDAPDTIVVTKDAEDIIVISIEAFYTLKNASGSIVGSGTINVNGDVNITYFSPVECKTIEIKFASSTGSNLYIGGLSVGDPLEIEYILNDPTLGHRIRGVGEKTDGGQLLGREIRHLRVWSVSTPIISNSKRLEIAEMVDTNGNYKPLFADLYEGIDLEPPMYCSILTAGEFPRRTHRNEFLTQIVLEECR